MPDTNPLPAMYAASRASRTRRLRAVFRTTTSTTLPAELEPLAGARTTGVRDRCRQYHDESTFDSILRKRLGR